MCGIVGYIGAEPVVPILIDGLKRLEYRGYDSAGIAVVSKDKIFIQKQLGKISNLEDSLKNTHLNSTLGIGHTRWATHGAPSVVNAHPHTDCSGDIAVIHNGIIENYAGLRQELMAKGHVFRSETDTEVLAHLIEEFYNGDLEQAVRYAINEVVGTYGILVVSNKQPDRIIAARNGSPLLIGIGTNTYMAASDATAVIRYTRDVVYLDDGELAVLTRDQYITKTIRNRRTNKHVEKISFDVDRIEKDGFDHFMLKEIFEQPQTLRDTMRGRVQAENGTVRLGGLSDHLQQLLDAKRILLTACGTSWHASLIGEYIFEDFLRIPVEVDYASEFRYRNPVLDQDSVVIVVSQSGETADTLAALREAKKRRAPVFGICNVVGSSIARETVAGVYIHAGPEVGVASTKAFTAQVTTLIMMTILMARKKWMSREEGRRILTELEAIPDKISEVLKESDSIREIAKKYADSRNFLYLGRGYNFPVALEGALKMKEISYIHAEGYPAAEMKHGPIALIDENMPVVFIAIKDSTYEKVLSNIEEVKARGGRVIAIASAGDEKISEKADHVIFLPETLEFLSPLVTIIPLQLLAYHAAVLRGCNVDQPRNLAKSVTVE
ncbi:glutamine--fructose-6-phosphate aminotransferase [isomerizing] [bacterium BMS3Abin05]|nr:glutamine--fructose-6-phosphate aminotransferase [isomerizing] [bacterium BMS3Abin05]GBE27403.1 glutamine--fructose-6-phosphate aminotransferase [isomerizing] [bacterium BMS3Bbin03]